jgi:hypothetical protein
VGLSPSALVPSYGARSFRKWRLERVFAEELDARCMFGAQGARERWLTATAITDGSFATRTDLNVSPAAFFRTITERR